MFVCCLTSKIYLPFSNVKDPRSFDEENLEVFLQTGHADVVHRPVPVVIVKVAKIFFAGGDLCPGGLCEGHPHVVLVAHPLCHIRLGNDQWEIVDDKGMQGISLANKRTTLKLY